MSEYHCFGPKFLWPLSLIKTIRKTSLLSFMSLENSSIDTNNEKFLHFKSGKAFGNTNSFPKKNGIIVWISGRSEYNGMNVTLFKSSYIRLYVEKKSRSDESTQTMPYVLTIWLGVVKFLVDCVMLKLAKVFHSKLKSNFQCILCHGKNFYFWLECDSVCTFVCVKNGRNFH